MKLISLPKNYPENGGEAFALLTQKAKLDVEDLNVLALIEASGNASYSAIADTSDNEVIQSLLKKNGREEVGHAHRIMKALTLLTGDEYELPSDEENPLVSGAAAPALSIELLNMFIQAEYSGEPTYNRWADNEPNVEVAKIYRLIGADEVRHANRLEQVLEIFQQ